MKEKIKEKMKERRREDERKVMIVEKCLKQKNPPDESAHNDSKKFPSDEIFVRKFRHLPVFELIIYTIRIRIFGLRELIQIEFRTAQYSSGAASHKTWSSFQRRSKLCKIP